MTPPAYGNLVNSFEQFSFLYISYRFSWWTNGFGVIVQLAGVGIK
jgi:hypothetical protein